MFKIYLLLCLFFAFNLMAAEQSVEVLLKKTEINSTEPDVKTKVLDLFVLNGMRQAMTKELVEKSLDSELFWSKIEEKKLTEIAEQEFFKPFFISQSLAIPDPELQVPKIDQFSRAIFNYELDSLKAKKLFDELFTNLPDVTLKTFYILPDINIDSEMKWEDVGVTKKENFSGVIIESWKKWAAGQFKNFVNIVVLEKDFTQKPENMNPESVTLKWVSNLKKTEVFQDRKSARFELTAQYVLINTKSGGSLVGFDFPNQKREINISKPKDLSSILASLVYNLLNSQTIKISSALEMNRASSTLTSVEIKVMGKHGLLDISQLNTFLSERFKHLALTSELKSYSSDASIISIKSTASSDSLYALFAKDGGKFPLNEQKILLFAPATHSFAIISKEANN